MAYSTFDATKPVSTDSGTAITTEVNANEKALRDAVLMGRMQGFAFSVTIGSGTALQPQYMLWKNGATWLRATLTWGTSGGANYNITQIVWDLSINTGSDYTTAPGGNIGTETLSYDTNGNLTATTGAGGFSSWLCSLIGRMNVADLSIVALNAVAAALGTMADQNASAVAIAGGSGSFTYTRENITALGSITAPTAVDWRAQGIVTVTAGNSSAALSFTNLPAGGGSGPGGGLLVKVTNGGIGNANFFGTVKKPGGSALALTSSGYDWVSLVCVDGATVEVLGINKNYS